MVRAPRTMLINTQTRFCLFQVVASRNAIKLNGLSFWAHGSWRKDRFKLPHHILFISG